MIDLNSNIPDYGRTTLYLSFLCNEESITMGKNWQDRARGMLLLGSLFICANIHCGKLYFESNENSQEN
jgi:hypothetical protein